MVEHIEPMKPIIEEIVKDMGTQRDNHILQAIVDVGINVDKERLIKALTDAKSFYEEGYRAAMEKARAAEVRHGEWIVEENGVIVCSECGEEHEWDEYRATFCEDCGARMDGKGEGSDDHLTVNGVTVQEWISVKDRLPEESGTYLVHYHDDIVGEYVITREYWEKARKFSPMEYFEEHTGRKAMHWMPLPQPPEGE